MGNFFFDGHFDLLIVRSWPPYRPELTSLSSGVEAQSVSWSCSYSTSVILKPSAAIYIELRLEANLCCCSSEWKRYLVATLRLFLPRTLFILTEIQWNLYIYIFTCIVNCIILLFLLPDLHALRLLSNKFTYIIHSLSNRRKPFTYILSNSSNNDFPVIQGIICRAHNLNGRKSF